MPPLHKSFSEQNRPTSKRAQPQWQRSKSNPMAKAAPPKPLLPVSETTRNKLHAFQFEPQPESDDVAPKAPAAVAVAVAAAPPSGKENVSPPRPRKPSSSNNAHVATTPVTRLSWQDLLGNQELPKEEDKAVSPSERVLWLNDRGPSSFMAMSPMVARKGRKRARSSSPISSPAAPKCSPNIDVKGLSRVLKTPHTDPALELWDRFSLPGAEGSPSGLTNPLLAHLMIPSSPRPSKDGSTPGSERTLRKAISCGSHWPKRRKTERSDAEPGAILEGSSRRNTKSSMVSALLETVDGELRKSKSVEAQVEQLRSPSPQKRPPPKRQTDASNRSTLSPAGEEMEGEDGLDQGLEPTGADSVGDAGRAGVPIEISSDYGDDDFDEDTLVELDATLQMVQGHATAAPAVEQALRQPSPSTTADEDFGDLDDDFLDEAVDLITKLEASQPLLGLSQTQPQQGKLPPDIGEDDDDFGDDFGEDFDFDAAERAAAVQPAARVAPSSTHSSQKPKAIQRYRITNVLDESSYLDDWGHECPEKILIVQAEKPSSTKTLHLRGEWCDRTKAVINSYVHVIGEFEASGRCIIDNSRNMVILHPDQLISSTVVADSYSCLRRAVLQDRVKATGEASPPMVYGTILHEIFQEALLANKWDMGFLGSVINKTLEKHLEDLYVIKVSLEDARNHLSSKMPELKSWAQAFISPHPRPEAVVQGRNGEKVNMCVSKLLDVEEHVWSPMYGLKGNIDATVQVTMKDGNGSKTLTVPFEVKTGKNVNHNHQAQTALYNLLLSDRYDIEIAYGILYYMETSQTIRIPAVRQQICQMIMQRNELASHLYERSVQLPPMLRNKNACGRCYAQSACFTYHKLADDGNGESSGLNEKFDELVQHLSPTHKEFFLKWEDLLTKEEKETRKMRRELWTMLSTEREKVGRCFANVIIKKGSASEDANQAKINRFCYTLVKEKPSPTFSFIDSQLSVGEPIVISDEQGHFALALGYITAITKLRISVAVDRRLHNARIRQPGFDEVNNQVFASIMEAAPKGSKSPAETEEPVVRYRLDKDEFSNGMATVRNNLVQAMANGPFGSKGIRRLVIDLVAPRFKTVTTQYVIPTEHGLNVDQKAAVTKVMSAMDYALVLGMPGTGKTTTIAHIIRALISQGKTVLLTSYTHSAVDTILLKLKDDKIPILRLGVPAKVHPEVQGFVTMAGLPMGSLEEIHRAWNDTPIVATTCLGVNHPIFNERTFDYCIVDEASQITLPICIGPIRMAKTFVLVGDHNQLPPLVQNEEARVGGLDISLFKLLSDTHPESVVNLEHQYRMCEDIMALSNTLIYKGHLKCGTSALRFAKLSVPNMDALRQRHYDAAGFISHSLSQQRIASPTKSPKRGPISFCPGPQQGTCWLRDLLEPEARVRFVNIDALPDSREEAKGNRIVNLCEVRVVTQLVEALLTVGIPTSDIGIMTHYRSQLQVLKDALRPHNAGGLLEMHTADRFQGRDKEVVILSLVRANDACSIGELLKDWRRINVAFTRAKTKLLVVGSRSTLRGCGGEEMLAKFVKMMEEREWIYDLPAEALEAHVSCGVGTQVTASLTSPVNLGGVFSKRARDASVSPSSQRSAGRPKQVGGVKKMRPEPKKARIGERVLLKGKPVLRDILNDMMGGY